MEKTIVIDCSPGYPRPDDLIAEVIEGTVLRKQETSSRCFGAFTWNYSDVSDTAWKEIQPILKERITELYNLGTNRYGSW